MMNKKASNGGIVILLIILAVGIYFVFIKPNLSTGQECFYHSSIDGVLNYDHNLDGNFLDFSQICSNEACGGKTGYVKSGTIYKVNGGQTTDIHLNCVCKN